MTKKNELQVISPPDQPIMLEPVQEQDYNMEVKGDIYALAEADAFRDMLRAAAAKQVIDNTAILAAVVEHYSQIAPSASNEYHQIIEAYVKTSMGHIFGGGGW